MTSSMIIESRIIDRERLHRDAEARLGRPLTLGERHLDLLGLDKAIQTGKNKLQAVIEQEKRRAIKAHVDRDRKPVLQVTTAMTAVLQGLFEQGRAHALAELKRMGLEPAKTFAMPAPPPEPVKKAKAKLKLLLAPIGRRIEVETEEGKVSGRFDDLARGAVLRAVDRRVPGARDAASRVVTTALYGGRGDVLLTNEGLFRGVSRSAVLDASTCPPCEAGDGTFYESFAAAEADGMPLGGPAEDCDGDGRCRCTLVAEV